MERNYLAIDPKIGGAVTTLEKAITRIFLGKVEEEEVQEVKESNPEWRDKLVSILVDEEPEGISEGNNR